MVHLGAVRRWSSEPLEDAVAQIGRRCAELLNVGDRFRRDGLPVEWSGVAARGAHLTHRSLVNRLDRGVEAVEPLRKVAGIAADRVRDLRRALNEVEEEAARQGFAIRDDGRVVDRDPGADPGRAGQREPVRAALQAAVARIIHTADEIDQMVDDALRTALDALAGPRSASGDNQPPVPGMPPFPPTDPGAGEHGSDPWWTTGDDRVKKELAYTAATIADAMGLTNAASHLRHYLGNSGEDLIISPDRIARDVEQFQAQTDQTVAAELRRIAAEVEANGGYGEPVQFSTDWQGFYITKSHSEDWFYAMGGIQYAVTGVATVYPPGPDGQPTVVVDYQTHVFDRYNWDEGKQVTIGPVTITDEQMAEMHRAGVAQEFNMYGSSEPRRYEGTVPPPGQVPDLPQPPESRDGTRTGPRR